MRMVLGIVSLALVGGCIEQGFSEDLVPEWQSNPQGLEDARVVDEFVQSRAAQADVLFVISNWWSADTAQAELISSFDAMLDVFVGSGIDYHIGVISTDTDHADDNGKLRDGMGLRFIQEDTPAPEVVFAEMATMDAYGCIGPRRPRDATFKALEHHADGHNAGFRRDDASMHTVFVNDSGDESYVLSLDEWIDWYQHFTNTPSIDTLSTIVPLQMDSENVYATDVIGGTSHPIADKPWANVLENIGVQAQGFKKEFFLSSVPDVDSLEVVVEVNNTELRFDVETDWWFDAERNSVQFVDYQPPELSTIRIGYVEL